VKKRRVVLANGCFDVFHAGHAMHLEAAKEMGDVLIVALTVDHAVNKGPGLPIHSWEQRATVLRALRCVDEVLPSTHAINAILSVKPSIFVKGIDYRDEPLEIEREMCRRVGAAIRFTTTPKFSSRETVEKIVERIKS
jgi:D-beta-D-heptose 7-phosphate kinase/D-beta-D-heptose 1-phosphate adenosyltransferase